MSNPTLCFVCIHAFPSDEALPLGAACVASAIKALLSSADPSASSGVDIHILEAFPSEASKSLADRVLDSKPDLVGFSIYSWNRALAVMTGAIIQAKKPGLLLVCGGPDVGANPTSLSKAEGGPFDHVISGEGELAAAMLVEMLRGSLGPFPNPASDATFPMSCMTSDLSSLSSPWLDSTLDPKDRPGLLWELSRGCPYGCAFCYESKGQRRVRYYPEDRLRQELMLFAASGVSAVFVLDPTFNAQKERTGQLLDLIQKEAPHIHWHFEVRAEALDRDQARRFARLGASLQIGLQSADPAVCAAVGRIFDKKIFSAKIAQLNDAGVVFGLDLIYGLPKDTIGGYTHSLDYALSLYPNNLDLFRLSVLPGTVLGEEASPLGLVHDDTSPYLVRATPSFPSQDLDRAQRLSNAASLFYNMGRAVAWFNQVIHPLGCAPSAFLEKFADFLDVRSGEIPGKTGEERWSMLMAPSDPVALERLQLAYLDSCYENAALDHLLPALWDIVRFHGAWGRALAEGISTRIAFNYDPDEVIGRGAVDLEALVALMDPKPCTVLVQPGQDEPELSIVP